MFVRGCLRDILTLRVNADFRPTFLRGEGRERIYYL